MGSNSQAGYKDAVRILSLLQIVCLPNGTGPLKGLIRALLGLYL